MSSTTIHSPSARPSSAGPARVVRLTNRGRMLIVGLLCLLAFFAVFGLRSAVGSDQSGAGGAGVTQRWVVQPGETLWTIAEATAPASDPRDVVDQLVEINGLAGSGVEAGQSLEIPA